MSLTHAATRQIALVRRTSAGRDSDGIKTWTETAQLVTGLFAPEESTEANQAQDQVVTQPTVYLPPGSVITAVDAVVPDPVLDGNDQLVLDGDGLVQGTRYEVDGAPDAWTRGTVIRLKRVTG